MSSGDGMDTGPVLALEPLSTILPASYRFSPLDHKPLSYREGCHLLCITSRRQRGNTQVMQKLNCQWRCFLSFKYAILEQSKRCGS